MTHLKIGLHLLVLSLLLSSVKPSVRNLFDVENPKFFNPNDQVKIDFGFSLALFTNETHRSLLVGAPLANTSQAGVISPGALYNCDLFSEKDVVYCSQLDVDTKKALEKYSSYISDDAKDFQRLGASLATRDNNIVVCAPNWHYFEMRLDSPIDTPVGTCYISSSLENFEQFSVPYDLYGDQSIDYLRTGSCQSGFSAAMTKNYDSVLGSPGCYNWQGDIFAGHPSMWTQFGKNFTEGDFEGASQDKKIWISNKYVGYSVAQGTFNNVQGVAAGSPRATNTPKSIKQSNGEDLLIISPMVNIFLEDEKWLSLWVNLLPPRNTTGQVDAIWLFSYFGYAVAVADVDGNGLDDIIVGAPFYHNETQKDQGAIVVYQQEVVNIIEVTQQKFKMSMERHKKLRVGQREYGRFGSCISPIGDIDGDGFQDIAVGAPFSPDGGQVYIFLGSKDGLPDLPLYVISSSDPHLSWKNLKNFGAAIAPRFMLKDGSQADLAIGSVASDTVVIFMSKVMIAVEWSVKFPERMDLRSKCALKRDVAPCTEMVTCLSFNFLEKGKKGDVRPKEFLLHHKLDVNGSPRRLFFENEKTSKAKNIYVEFNKMICFYDKVYTSRQIENFDPFEIIAEIKHIPRLKDDRSSLNSRQEKKKRELLGIVVQCNANEIAQCECDTTLHSNVFPTLADASDVKLNVSYEITNTGEPAYSMRLIIKTDDFLVVSGKPIISSASTTSSVVDCRKIGKGTLECYLGNFVNDFDLLRFSLILTTTQDFLKPSNLRHHLDKFKMASSLTSLSTFKNSSAVMTENFVNITIDPQISLTKDKSTNYILYNDSDVFVYPEDAGEDMSAIGPLVNHVYKIFNPENYVIENNEVTLYWPLKIKEKYLLYRMSLPAIPGIKNVLEKCKKRKEKGAILEPMAILPFIEDISWFVLTCNVAAFKPGQKVSIDISSRLVLKTIRNEVAALEFDEIYSFMTIKSSPKLLDQEFQLSYINHIPTEIDYGDHNFNQIKWWMVLVATILACLILTIIIFVLCKFNFFKRKKVEPTEVSEDRISSHELEEEIEATELQVLKSSEGEDYDNINTEK